VSQSGALTASILDWAQHNGVGFSAVVSLGPNTAVDLPQVLDFLATMPARRASWSTWKASATRGAS
jgi:acetyltransferase